MKLKGLSYHRYPGFLMSAVAEWQASFCVCSGPKLYVFYSAAGKRASKKTLRIKFVPYKVFFKYFGHGHLQHAGSRWEVSSCLDCHACFILSHTSLKGDISYAYGEFYFFQLKATCPIDIIDDEPKTLRFISL